MKKITIAIIALILALFCLAACGGEGGSDDECDHEFGDWKVTKEATCAEKGIRSRTCELCGEREREYIEGAPHVEEVVEGYPATCQKEGLSDGKRCTVCGNMTVEQTVIEPLPHTVVVNEGKEPTCTRSGYTESSYCSVCYETVQQQQTLEALGHAPTLTAEVPATCMSYGSTAGEKCSRCDEVLKDVETILLTSHKFSGGKCSVCGESEKANLDLKFSKINDGYSVSGIGNCTATEIIIPRTYEGYFVTSIAKNAFKGNKNITSVVIPDTVTTLNTAIFQDCSSLKSVTLGNGITTIPNN
ncbi:MAG: leucine-rich repeat protein, partial [Clostridia bacterium]|nr:leucine-rich repeat protein [Clostridia bacterium]